MGSWNQTCLLTGLPILPGDPVVALVIRPLHDDAVHGPFGPSYATSRYTPVSLPLSGVYDSYGGIENVLLDQGADSLRAHFAAYGVTDLDVNALGDLLDANARAVDSMRDPNQDPSDLLPEVAALLARAPELGQVRHHLVLMHADAHVALPDAMQASPDGDALRATGMALARLVGPDGIRLRGADRDDEVFAAYHRIAHDARADAILDWFETQAFSPEAQEALGMFALLLAGLHATRRSLQPMSGQGCQHVCWNAHLALLRAAQAIIATHQNEEAADGFTWNNDR